MALTLQQCKTLVFVGYSLADIDIARLIFNPELINRKTHFVDRKDIDPVLNTKLSRFGTVHPIGIECFADLIRDEASTWVAPKYFEEYSCWRPITIDWDYREPTDDDFYDLILRGISKPALLRYQSEIPNQPVYMASRNVEASCMELLQRDNTVAVVSGSFANGKTLTAQSVSLALVAQGRDVFFLDHPYDTVVDELQQLCKRQNDFVLIIENYVRNLRLIETFCRYARTSCALLVTERSEMHELNEGALFDRTKGRELHTFDLDTLDNTEVDRISKLFDLRGLWGERAGLRETQKLAYIKDEALRKN